MFYLSGNSDYMKSYGDLRAFCSSFFLNLYLICLHV